MLQHLRLHFNVDLLSSHRTTTGTSTGTSTGPLHLVKHSPPPEISRDLGAQCNFQVHFVQRQRGLCHSAGHLGRGRLPAALVGLQGGGAGASEL